MLRVYFDYFYTKHITSLMCSKYIRLGICGKNISKLLHKQNLYKVSPFVSPAVWLKDSISSYLCPHMCANRPTDLFPLLYFPFLISLRALCVHVVSSSQVLWLDSASCNCWGICHCHGMWAGCSLPTQTLAAATMADLPSLTLTAAMLAGLPSLTQPLVLAAG